MATKPKVEKMTLEKYRAYLAKINLVSTNEEERRRLIGEIIKRNANKRDVGDFNSTVMLRMLRDGKRD